jgi:amino acid transporter
MLLLLAVVAIVRVGIGHAPAGHAAFSWSWLNPAHFASPSVFMAGMLLMVFIYWGWDTTTSINEETADPHRIPGLAGVVSTLSLLGTYFVVILSVQMFAGFGSSGIGLGNSNNVTDVLSPMGGAVFGNGAVGEVLSRLLLLMVLSSAAATTQTTILPTARTTLSMSFHKALPAIFGRVPPRYLTPWFSTIAFSVASAVMYVAMNFVSGGNVLADSVTAATFFVELYLGSTGFACFWFYRKSLLASAANFWLRGIIPLLSDIMLLVIGGWAVCFYTNPSRTRPGRCRSGRTGRSAACSRSASSPCSSAWPGCSRCAGHSAPSSPGRRCAMATPSPTMTKWSALAPQSTSDGGGRLRETGPSGRQWRGQPSSTSATGAALSPGSRWRGTPCG